MENRYNKAVEKYYMYKNKYMKEYEKLKDVIKEMNKKKLISVEETHKRIKDIKMNCVFCKRKVNTLFFKKKGVLYMTCGDEGENCNKSIEIRMPEYLQITDLIEYFNNDIQKIVEEVINIKTKLILNLHDKEELLAEFEEYIELYNDTNEINNRLKYKIEQMSLDSKKNDIESIESEIKTYKENIKTIMNNYNSLTIKDNNLLRETNRIYKDNILPLEENLNDLKFKRREISTETNNYYFLKIYNNDINDMETIADAENPEVLKFDEPKYFDNYSKPNRQSKPRTRKNI